MRRWGTAGVLLLCLILVGAVACSPLGGSPREETSRQLAKVVRGDLVISVSGNGNIEASHEARLSFGSGGRIDKIYVKEGDVVSKGEVLARIDTSALELAQTRAEVAFTQAEVTLTQMEVALTQAELTRQMAELELESTRDKKDALELALLKAQIDLRTAEHHLGETRDLYTWPDIQTAQREVDEWKAYVNYANDNIEASTTAQEKDQWTRTLLYAQARLTAAEAKLDAKVRSYDTEEVAIARLQVAAAEMAVAQVQKNLDKVAREVAIKELQVKVAELSLKQSRQSIEQARQSVELARQSLKDAQKQLDESTIIAPLDGVVASVYVKEGDIIPAPTMAPKAILYLVDLSSMELTVELDEIDMPGVRLDQEVTISLDALPALTLKGKVTSIHPLPTTVGGIVMYNVEISFAVPENADLKVGMSASADITISKRSNVLLVPSRAIGEDSQGNAVVKVMVNEQIQKKPVVIGISDELQTEIVSGLSEGETVVVESRAKTEPSGIGLF